MSKIIDVRGGDDGPLLGRLRGVIARHELRPVVGDVTRIYSDDVSKAHFVLRRPLPTPLPEVWSNAERQLVVSADVAARLPRELERIAVRVTDGAGNPVADAVLVVIGGVDKVVDGGSNGFVDGYFFNEVRYPPEPAAAPRPVFRIEYTLIIGCDDDVASALTPLCTPASGVRIVDFPRYTEIVGPRPPSAYMLLRAGTEGAELKLDGIDDAPIDKGETLAPTWPRTASATMQAPKSRKKIVDFTGCSGAPVITEKTKALLEARGLLEGVELLPVVVNDHAGKPVKGTHWLFHVTRTHDYVDVAESDIEVKHGLLWSAREIVVDDSKVGPAFFRVPGARYPWVFVRSDVVPLLEQAKLTGFRVEHPGRHCHSVEGGGLRGIC